MATNFPTFHSHPKSFDSASTPEQMARRELELGTGYITVTDHGTLEGCRQIYDLTHEKEFKGLKPILGLEAYFRDSNCPELAAAGVSRDSDGSFGEYLKYGKKDLKYNHVTLHCLNEAAYFAMTKQISQAPLEKHGSEVKPMFTWKDLEVLGAYDITVGSGCLIGMVSRHLLAHENASVAVRYYERLRSTFKPGNFYVEVFPHQCDSNWDEGVFIRYEDGVEERFKPRKKFKTEKGEVHADTLAKAFKKDAAEARRGHVQLLEVMNNRKWEPGNLKPIVSVEYREGFIQNDCRPWCPDGDVQGGSNRFLLKMAQHYGDPVVVSDDSHFATPEEKIIQDIRLGQSGGWKFSKSYHRQTGDMALAIFKAQLGVDDSTFESWVDNNRTWASRFNDFNFSPRRTLPTKFYPQDTFGHLKALIHKHGRMDWKNPDWCLRLQQEVELLHQNGTIDLLPYFFVLEEAIDLYMRHGELVGPGRGSAAGVLLPYLLNITQIEPIKNKLSLDRFLTLDRIESGKLPDVDTDFSTWDLLVDPKDPKKGWLQERFGDCYARLSTDVCLHLKQSIRDVFRIRNGRERDPEIEQLCRELPDPPQGISDRNFVFGYEDGGNHVPGLIETSPALQKFVQTYPSEWGNIQKLIGLQRYKSIHPCGFIICDESVQNFIPTVDMDGVRVTQYNATSVEAAGGLKMDYLRVISIRDIGLTLKIIQARHRSDIDWNSAYRGTGIPSITNLDGRQIPLYRLIPSGDRLYDIWDLPTDFDVYRDICEGRVETVFQLDAPAARQGLKNFRVLPDGTPPIKSIADLAAFTALDRPGPLDAYVTATDGSRHNMLVEFANRARGLPAVGALEILDQELPETNGVLCVAEGSLVWTDRGPVPIEDVVPGDLVITELGLKSTVSAKNYNGIKNTIRIRLSTGAELKVTPDHRVLTQYGWVAASELTRYHLVKQFWPSEFSTIPYGDDRDWLVGLMIADGDVCSTSPSIACSSRGFAEHVKRLADATWPIQSTVYLQTSADKKSSCWHVRLARRGCHGTSPNPVITELKSKGLWGCDFSEKRLPPNVSLSLLAGVFEGDGCVDNCRIRIKNKKLAQDIFYNLQLAHIPSAIHEDESDAWAVVVHGNLPLRIKTYTRENRQADFVPSIRGQIPRSDGDRQILRKKIVGRSVAERVLLKYPSLQVDLQRWGRVLSVKNDSYPSKVYDLSVDGVHSFVVGGSVVHNCYQEQLQRIFQKIGGTSAIDANNFRADIGKKKMAKVIKWGEKFREGAGPKIGREQADLLWGQMQTFGQYGFCAAHAFSYATNAYTCAWLKHHYPLEWWTAVLQNAKRNEVNEDFWPHCGKLIALPNLSTSGANFEIIGDKIQAPLWLLKGIGDAAHQQLLEIRPFANIEEFLQKVEAWKQAHPRKLMKKNKDTGEMVETQAPGVTALKKTVIQNLIVTGVADNLFPEKDENGEPATVVNRLTWYCEAMKKVTGKKVESLSSQYNLESAIVNYQLKKQVLPAYSEDLLSLCRASKPRAFIDAHGRPTLLHVDAREAREMGFPVITGREWEILKVLPLPAMQEDRCTALAYVISQTSKKYVQKETGETRQMTELLLDADGFRTKVLRFGGRNGLPESLKQNLTGAVISCLLVRRQGQTDQFLLDVVVLAPPLKKKEDENADTETSP